MEVHRVVIKSREDFKQALQQYRSTSPLAAAFDTETDGLHIFKCKPFVFQFGWVTQSSLYAYAVELTDWAKEMIREWNTLVQSAPVYLAHNVKFDLHMLENVGLRYTGDNLSDTMFHIRFAHDNVSARQGGVILGLKDYCTKYIDTSAKFHEKKLKDQRTVLAKVYNKQLKQQLGWTLKKVDEFFKDSTNTLADLPSIQDYMNYMKWKTTLPKELQHIRGKVDSNDIPYTLLDREVILDYAVEDIVLTLKVWLQTAPTIELRGTQAGLDLENKSILPLWKMERHGLPVDKGYVQTCFDRMRRYIREQRQHLIDLTGQEVTCNQHLALKNYFQEQGVRIPSTGSGELNKIKNSLDGHLKEVVETVEELRTLEKWMSTYLMRFLGEDMIYTSINQVGAASLRMSSDFQQFPKKGLKTRDGRELFNPRRAIKAPQGRAMVYLDYSQIELRVQALYTILVGHPDTNLCRAYMPYRCLRGTEEFDYNNPQHIREWDDPRWTLAEDTGARWTPTDVHGATAKAAFNITEDHPNFRDLRSLGKTVNFAKNFGAQRGKIAEMFPQHDEATINAIDQGYYTAFPGIKHYQQYCYNIGQYQSYATNLFGIRYWNVSGHNLINMLIQGSAATLLKGAIVEMDKFLENYETQMVMPVHDEVQFAMPKEEFHIIPELTKIMEKWEGCLVPIVVDAEVSYTNWAEKEDYNG